MDCNDKNKRFLVYNTAWDKKCKKESNVNAECCVIVDDDNCENLYSKFEECIKKDITDDIVEIVRKIRGILNGNEEIKLKVQIRKGDYIQDVEYFDGVLYNCSFSNKNWDDLVSVSRNCRGTGRILYGSDFPFEFKNLCEIKEFKQKILNSIGYEENIFEKNFENIKKKIYVKK